MVYPSIVLGGAVYLASLGILMNTRNLKSGVLFKLIPIGLGIAELIVAGKLYGWF